MSRAKFQHLADNECTLATDGDPWDAPDECTTFRVTRTYWAPRDGGYVRDTTDKPGTLGQQICDGLGRVVLVLVTTEWPSGQPNSTGTSDRKSEQ